MRLIFLALLFSLNADAVTPSGLPQITLGATAGAPAGLSVIPVGSPSSLGAGGTFTIYAGPGTGNTANNVMPFRRNGALYRVGDQSGLGSAVKAYCFSFTAAAATGSSLFQYMSATATFADNATTASLTGVVYQSGVANSFSNVVATASASVPAPQPGMFVFGAQTWPGIQIASSINYYVSASCYEAP